MAASATLREALQQRSIVEEFQKIWEGNRYSLAEVKKEAGETFDLVDFRQLYSEFSTGVAEAIIAQTARHGIRARH